MNAVRLNRRLILEQRGGVADGAGGYAEAWTALGVLWGDLRPGSARATGGEDLALSRMTYRITVRAGPEGALSRPRAGQRFRDGDRTFPIDAVSEVVPGGMYLICFVHEEAAR